MNNPQVMHTYREQALDLMELLERNYKSLGRLLNEWEASGEWDDENYSSWPAFCEGELGLPSRNRQMMQQVDRVYRIDLSVDPQAIAVAHHSKLALLAPVATDENVDLIVSDCARDSGKSMTDLKKLKDEGEYTGEAKPIEPDPERVKCSRCGSLVPASKVQQ